MPTPPTPDKELLRTREIWERCGYNQQATAQELGMSRAAVQSRLLYIFNKWGDPRKEVAAEIQTRPNTPIQNCDDPRRPTIRVRLQWDMMEDWDVVVIGDYHAATGISNERAEWIGKYAKDRLEKSSNKTALIAIGDWWTFDSLSFHDRNDSLKGKAKPNFQQDLRAGWEALELLLKGMGKFRPDVSHMTMGNHDCPIYGRPGKFTNSNPEIDGMFLFEIEEAVRQAGFTWSPLGVVHQLGGVGFTHAPLTGLGKEVAGEMPSNTVARDSIYDTVYGHTHKSDYHRRAKLGHGISVTALNVGCSLPWGHYEHYMKQGTKGEWWWGLTHVRIREGRIHSYDTITMIELEERFAPAR